MNNNNSISQITDNQTMTSIQIAEVTGKQHCDVLRAIRKMEPAWEAEKKSKFTFLLRKSKAGAKGYKMNPLYVLNKTECLYVATKFNDQARAKLVLRWEQLEKERLQQPQATVTTPQTSSMPIDPRNMSRLQILQLALQAEEEKERLRAEKEELEAENFGLMIESGEKDQQIQQLTERTAYLNVIMSDHTNVTVSQIAQDYGMAAVAFNKLLNGLRIQRRVGEQWILYSDYLNMGYVATRMIPIHHADGPDTFKPMTTWTQKGRHFLYDQLKKHGVLPIIERSQPA